MPNTVQSIYQWYTFLNPLVQKKHFFSFHKMTDRNRTVSRMEIRYY